MIRKAEDPVWTKPDWAFVEEGKPVPGKWSERRTRTHSAITPFIW